MDTLDRIRAMAAKRFGGDPQAIDPDVALEQLGADSLGYLEFLFDLEEAFGITIDQDAATGIRNLRALGVLIDELLSAKASAAP